MQKQNNHQKPQWGANKKYNENSWQEALHQVAETKRKEQEHQDNEKRQEELAIEREEASYKKLYHVQELDQTKVEPPLEEITTHRREIVY